MLVDHAVAIEEIQLMRPDVPVLRYSPRGSDDVSFDDEGRWFLKTGKLLIHEDVHAVVEVHAFDCCVFLSLEDYVFCVADTASPFCSTGCICGMICISSLLMRMGGP
jgi:hypothetical protein